MVVHGCGLLWMVIGSCGWFWLVVNGCGWLWMVAGGCGRLHTLVQPKMLFSALVIYRTLQKSEENTCDGVLLKKVAGCFIIKKGLHHIFFLMKLVKFFRKTFF